MSRVVPIYESPRLNSQDVEWVADRSKCPSFLIFMWSNLPGVLHSWRWTGCFGCGSREPGPTQRPVVQVGSTRSKLAVQLPARTG